MTVVLLALRTLANSGYGTLRTLIIEILHISSSYGACVYPNLLPH